MSLFIYDKKQRTFTQCSETALSSHNLLERQDLEKWVMNSPEILGEDLLIVTNEYDKFDKVKERLDLLALDRDGKLVVIELKRDESGKNVELQALKYAAYCSTLTIDQLVPLRKQFLGKRGEMMTDDQIRNKLVEDFIENEEFEELDDKPRIILVAQDYRPEVTSSVLWLRKFGVDISCIKLTPYLIDDDRIAIVSSKLIPLPEAEDYIVSAEKKESAESLGRTLKEYEEFYRELRDRLAKELPNVTLAEPLPKYLYKIQTGMGGVHFEWAFHGRPRNSFYVELHFQRNNADENNRMLREIAKSKDEIMKETREEVTIEENWRTNYARLYLAKNEGKMTEDLKTWAVDKMTLLYKIIEPKLQTIDAKHLGTM